MSINTPREYKSLFDPADAQTETDDDTETDDSDTENTKIEKAIELAEDRDDELTTLLVEIVQDQQKELADYRENTQSRLTNLIDIKADSLDEAEIDDIWITGQPLGKLVDTANTRSKNNASDIVEIKSNGAGEADSSDAEGGVNDQETTGQNRKSGIEQVCGIPDEMARKQLPKNGQRARYVALRVLSLAGKGPYGDPVIESDQLKEILDDYDDSGHTQTVSRVMDFLEDFADGDSIRTAIRDKTRRIVFDLDLAKRLSAITPEPSEGSDTPVVIGGRS